MQNVYTVSWVNAYIKNMISQDFMLQALNVKGEASNVKYHSSGHLYFTLKDGQGAIPCVLFAKNRSGLKFHLEDGTKIIVNGTIDVYERDGRYQIYAKEITLAGIGELYERYERLKEELRDMGMFDPMYKQQIPTFVRRLGIVTAPTGAAVRDIISITKRRNPYVEIILYPAIVQGDAAKESIVSGIQTLDEMGVDVIIVGRGGGSIEDLWAFNEEVVAHAIFNCSTPIISAVGHETDTTIADYVADLRAPTPSAAAELAICEVEAMQEKIGMLSLRMSQLIEKKLSDYALKIKFYESRLKSLSVESRLKEKRMQLLHAEEKLDYRMDEIINQYKHRLALFAKALDAVSPLKKIESGYAYVADDNKKQIKQADALKVDDVIHLTFLDGVADCKVTNVRIENMVE